LHATEQFGMDSLVRAKEGIGFSSWGWDSEECVPLLICLSLINKN